jgi:Domain of unknown function (DUF4279)
VSEYEFTLSLRIRHPSVEPAEITRNLGIEPQHTWRAGDPRRDVAGSEINGTYRESYWMGRLMAKPELAADQVGVESEVLRTLALLRRSFGFFVTLKAEGGVAELHVSIFAREEFSLEFLPESLSLLGRLGLTVAIEVKPHPFELTAIPATH